MKVLEVVKRLALLHGEKVVVGLLGLAFLVVLVTRKPWAAEAPEVKKLAEMAAQFEGLGEDKFGPLELEPIIPIEKVWAGPLEVPFGEFETPMLDLAENEKWAEVATSRWVVVAAPQAVTVLPELAHNVVEFSINYNAQSDNCVSVGWEALGLPLARALLYRRHVGEEEEFKQIYTWVFDNNVNINEAPLAEEATDRVREIRDWKRREGISDGDGDEEPPEEEAPPEDPDELQRWLDNREARERQELQQKYEEDQKRVQEEAAREHERRIEDERRRRRAARVGREIWSRKGRAGLRVYRRPGEPSSTIEPTTIDLSNLVSGHEIAEKGGFRYQDTDVEGGEQYQYEVELVVRNPFYDVALHKPEEEFLHSDKNKNKSVVVTAAVDLLWYFTLGMPAQLDRESQASCRVYRYYRYDQLAQMMNKPVTSTPGEPEEPVEEKRGGQWLRGHFSSLTPGSEIGGYQKVYVRLPGADKPEAVELDFSTGNVVVDVTLDLLVTEEARQKLQWLGGRMISVPGVRRKIVRTPRLTYLDSEGNLQAVWRTRVPTRLVETLAQSPE